jgi:Fe2+ or Zn2+ uptake regulation protein
VYRNVEELVGLGKLHKIQGIWSKALFEKVGESHFVHFIDTETGEIFDIPFSKALIESALPLWFILQDADLRIYWKKPQ